MRLVDLARLGIRYAIVGCVVAIFAISVFFVAYKIIYQKCMHGTKKIGKWKSVWFILFGILRYCDILLATFPFVY